MALLEELDAASADTISRIDAQLSSIQEQIDYLNNLKEELQTRVQTPAKSVVDAFTASKMTELDTADTDPNMIYQTYTGPAYGGSRLVDGEMPEVGIVLHPRP